MFYANYQSGFIVKILLRKTSGERDMSRTFPQTWHAIRAEMLSTLSISSIGSTVRSFMSTLHMCCTCDSSLASQILLHFGHLTCRTPLSVNGIPSIVKIQDGNSHPQVHLWLIVCNGSTNATN